MTEFCERSRQVRRDEGPDLCQLFANQRGAVEHRARIGALVVEPRPAPAPPPPDPGPSPTSAALRQRLDLLTGQVRSSGGRLPADVVAAYERVLAGLAGLVDRVERMGADAESRFVVGRIIDDYIPQAFNAYVDLPASFAREHRVAGGRTAHEELLHQLAIIETQVERITVSVYSGDAQSLAAQSRFLEERFAQSSLELPEPR